MELYNFYNIATLITSLFKGTERFLPIYGSVVGVLFWVVAFILQGVGISTMAKNRGIKNRGLAFVPFVNILYIGRLAGECQFFSQRVKRAGMYAMIAQIITTLFTIAMIAAEIYLWMMHGVPQTEPQLGLSYWPGLTGFSRTVSEFYDLSGYLLSIFQLICGVLLVILLMSLYKKYEPRNHFALSMLTLLAPISRFFIIFAIRKRKAIDYEAYMRARRDAYVRRQQYYNPYNNPYNRSGGNPYGDGQYGQNPYANGQHGQNPYGQSAEQNSAQPEEPFSEFSSSSNAVIFSVFFCKKHLSNGLQRGNTML